MAGIDNYSAFSYDDMYPTLVRRILDDERLGITDESPYSLHIQIVATVCYAFHIVNSNINVAVKESLLGSAELLESVRAILRIIGYTFKSASPSVAELVVRLTKDFTVSSSSVTIVPEGSQFTTDGTDEIDPVVFETLADVDVDTTTTEPSAAFSAEQQSSGSNGVTNSEEPDSFSSASLSLTSANIGDLIQIRSSVQGMNGTYVITTVPSSTKCTLVEFSDASTPAFKDESSLDWRLYSFSTDHAANLVAGTPNTTLFTSMSEDDAFYFMHTDIMWLVQSLVCVTPHTSFDTMSVEYKCNPQVNVKTPTRINDQTTFLEFDVTGLVGSAKVSGLEVRVKSRITGFYEDLFVQYGTGTGAAFGTNVNYITTNALLSQTSGDYSTNLSDYEVSSEWLPVKSLTGEVGLLSLAQTYTLGWDLPQSLSRDWQSIEVNGFTGHPLRLRIVSLGGGPVSPVISSTTFLEDKYLKYSVVQGETITEDPIGVSDGTVDQSFEISDINLLDDTVQVQVDGFSSDWIFVEDNFSSEALDNHYTIEQSSDASYLRFFGRDGKGRIPTYGADIAISYRVGGDVDGNVGANSITENSSGVAFIDLSEIGNPRPASGHTFKDGYNSDDIERLKIAGPASLRSLSGLVSPDAVEQAAINWLDSLGSSPVARATFIPNIFGVNSHQLVIVGQGGARLTTSQVTELSEFFNGTSETYSVLANNGSITITQYNRRVLPVTARVIGGGNKADIEAALTSLLNPTYKDLNTGQYLHYAGGKVTLSQLDHWIHDTDGNITEVLLDSPAATVHMDLVEYVYPGVMSITLL